MESFLNNLAKQEDYKINYSGDCAYVVNYINDGDKNYMKRIPIFAEQVLIGRGKNYKVKAVYYTIRIR